MTAYDPLHDTADPAPVSTTVGIELRISRAFLAEIATANIHDHTAMVKAATGLNYRLRALVTALDAERGERP